MTRREEQEGDEEPEFEVLFKFKNFLEQNISPKLSYRNIVEQNIRQFGYQKNKTEHSASSVLRNILVNNVQTLCEHFLNIHRTLINDSLMSFIGL